VKIIRKEMEGAMLSFLGPGPENWKNNRASAASTGLEGYSLLTTTSGPRFYLQDTIDISGLTTHMEKALVPTFTEVQQSPIYRAGGTAATEPDNFAWEIVMITTVPFDVQNWLLGSTGEFTAYRLPTIFGKGSVASTDTLSADQCIYGRMRYLQNDIETFERQAVVKGESFFGNPTATMAGELYVTRIAGWYGVLVPGAIFNLPDLEFVIHTEHKEMSDLSQIMELRRSYLLQQDI